MNPGTIPPNPALIFSALLSLPVSIAYRTYLRVSYPAAIGFLVAALVIGGFVTHRRLERIGHMLRQRDDIDQVFVPIACMAFFLALVALIVRLVRAWVYEDLTDNERKTGPEGIRAWLRGGNLFCTVVIAFTGWYGHGYSGWGLLLLCLLAIIAKPMLSGLVGQEAPNTPTGDDTLKGERERVMRLLEEGSIQADEASELLSALAATHPPTSSSPPPPPQARLDSRQKLPLIGIILILLGFFMPWFSINPGEELHRLTSELTPSIQTLFPESMSSAPMLSRNFSLPLIETGSYKVSGADIGHGLGWLVLLCGIASAFFIMAPQVLHDPATRKIIITGTLLLGTILSLYVIGNGLRHMSYGIILVVAGYLCIGMAAVRTLTAAAQPRHQAHGATL